MSDEGSEEEVYEETTTGATDAAIGGAEVNWNLVYVYINTLSLSLSLSLSLLTGSSPDCIPFACLSFACVIGSISGFTYIAGRQ
jgi:hypothetical protein